MIRGNRIKLRSFEKTHLSASKGWVNDPEIARGIIRVLPVSMYEHTQWYEKIIADKSRVTFAIETIKGKKYIGNAGLMNIDWKNRKGKLWIYLDKKVWGKGFGKEAILLLIKYAFGSLNLNKVHLDVGAFNEKAIKLYKSAGFKVDGILREDAHIDGEYFDVLRMSILRGEVFKK